jgi:flagellar motor switch protein FliM
MQHITLNDIYDWKVGDLIDLQSDIPPEVSLVYRNGRETHFLAKGEIGTIKNKKAVKITDEVIAEFCDDLSDTLLKTQIMVKIDDSKGLKFIK